MKTFFSAFRLLAVLSVLTGVAYPLGVWAVGRVFFRRSAEGSLIYRADRLVGSALLAQKNSDPRYFWPRPSAGDYATVASGASNLAWTSAKLRERITADEKQFRETNQIPAGLALPPDLITTSGSGLDPDLTPEATLLQVERVARARGLEGRREEIKTLVHRATIAGPLGPPRVNVLQLNLALDAEFR